MERRIPSPLPISIPGRERWGDFRRGQSDVVGERPGPALAGAGVGRVGVEVLADLIDRPAEQRARVFRADLERARVDVWHRRDAEVLHGGKQPLLAANRCIHSLVTQSIFRLPRFMITSSMIGNALVRTDARNRASTRAST